MSEQEPIFTDELDKKFPDYGDDEEEVELFDQEDEDF